MKWNLILSKGDKPKNIASNRHVFLPQSLWLIKSHQTYELYCHLLHHVSVAVKTDPLPSHKYAAELSSHRDLVWKKWDLTWTGACVFSFYLKKTQLMHLLTSFQHRRRGISLKISPLKSLQDQGCHEPRACFEKKSLWSTLCGKQRCCYWCKCLSCLFFFFGWYAY